MKSNRGIDSLIIEGSKWLIDPNYGITALNNYLAELEAVRAGVPYKELGMSARREASRPTLQEAKSTSNSTDSKKLISITRVNGVMRAHGGPSSIGMQQVADKIRAADAHPDVIGHIVEFDSGGGEATAGEILSQAIAETKKPTISVCRTCLSAAYMAAAESDMVLSSSKMSELGSIGALIQIDKQFVEMYKQRIDPIYSEKSPRKNEEFRAYLSGNKTPLIRRITKVDEAFMEQVKAARPQLTQETMSGALFSGDSAIENGLSDGYGGLSAAKTIILKVHDMALESKNTVLAKLFGSEQQEDTQLEAQLQELEARMSKVEGMLKDLETQLGVLGDIVSELKQSISDIEASTTSNTEKMTALDERVSELDSSLARAISQKQASSPQENTLTDVEKQVVSAGNSNNSGVFKIV